RVPNKNGSSTGKVGGLMVVNGQLVGTSYIFYDANASATLSHFKLSSLDLAGAQVSGLFQVGTQPAGAIAGYMAAVPPEWQAALGGPYLSGQGGIPIVSRTSSGPAAFGFDPQQFGAGTAPATPY